MIFYENRKLMLLNSRLQQGRKESLQVLSVTTKSRVAKTLRKTHSTGYEPKSLATDEFEPNELETKEFMTTSRSSLEDICQFYVVQREFGEQDQQAPKEFGQIGIRSLLDHEMTDTSPIEDMSYHQFQMHFDDSSESIAADSDLEDGDKKVAYFTTECPKSFQEMQWSFKKEW